VDTQTGNLGEVSVAGGGHKVGAYGYLINNDGSDGAQWLRRSLDLAGLGTTSHLISPLLTPGEFVIDSHLSWNQALPSTLVPVLISTYRDPSETAPWRAWDDEIIAVRTDGVESRVWRFAHHRSRYASFYDSPRGNVSQNGRFFMFTSNWEATLGAGRQDVFIVELPADVCTDALLPAYNSLPAGSASASLSVQAQGGCGWTAMSHADFITILSITGSPGNGTVSYSVAANTGTSARSGTITVAGQTFTLYQGVPFKDVPPGDQFYTEIGKLSARRITAGCGQDSNGNPIYCPDNAVTREQMAIFIMRSLGEFNPPMPATQRFVDVGPERAGYRFIERMAQLGITAGCGDGTAYCPDLSVTRAQMAIFIDRALGYFDPPTPSTATFADVPNSGATASSFRFIEQFASLGISSGCDLGPPRRYCPSNPVTRRQMARFLVVAFNL